jgi:hypothetical protein
VASPNDEAGLREGLRGRASRHAKAESEGERQSEARERGFSKNRKPIEN